MSEEDFEQEVHFYQQAIMEAILRVDLRLNWESEVPELSVRFNALAHHDRTYFHRLCAKLLEDSRHEVRLGAIKLIGSCRMRDNVLSVALAHIALKQKDLSEEALSALWRMGTRRALPQLLLLADKGYSSALYMIRRMIQTPEDIERGIAIARKYIDAQNYELREAALFLLQKYSDMEKEAERVLAAVQKYKDELFIDALKEAPPGMVLEPLKELRSTIEEKYAEYGDLSATIRVLEQKSIKHMSEGEDR